MNAYKVPRTGWHPATILMVVFGSLATLISGVSIVGIFVAAICLMATIAGVICGVVTHRGWRSVFAGSSAFAFLGVPLFALVTAAIAGLTLIGLGLGLILLFAIPFSLVASGAAFVELVGSINGMSPRESWAPAAQQAPIVIYNNNDAHVGHRTNNNYQVGAGLTGARLGIVEQGRRMPDVQVMPGRALVVGRGQDAQVRLTDRRASRHHLQVGVQNGAWLVRDLGSTNMAQVIAGDLKGQYIGGSAVQLRSGQLRIGQSIITLYPLGPGPW